MLIGLQSRDSVNYINQINKQADSAFQCKTTVGNQTVAFANLLPDIVGDNAGDKTGNNIKDVAGGSDIMPALQQRLRLGQRQRIGLSQQVRPKQRGDGQSSLGSTADKAAALAASGLL
ncbi:hypothetical protein PHYSODRAFT_301185 [Phytophthora sojae]|uniref:Uncharacterized protein n=1 Tax=Phytophthora sojae (strain P6497) TaxID=1094619 RepID=G4ZGE7_PHYSP|nr:hypothetical protein PHYSODRAFT_301185 [Phytophthora sojae]EGZ18592.1 hypothetical protein PHYSODRAFT_301185 [Phytophthora sojae]|eukprot:XP_009527650.1 hypothetical protein PHYSODRAFT_301185 [Phytophthora sojae]